MSDGSKTPRAQADERIREWPASEPDGQGVLLLQEDGSATHVNPVMEVLLAGTIDLARARQGLVGLEAHDAESGRPLRGAEHPFARAAGGEAFSGKDVRVLTMSFPRAQRWSVSAKPVAPREPGGSPRVWIVVRPTPDDAPRGADAR